MKLLIKMAKYKFIQDDEKRLLEVIHYVNYLSSHGKELADNFLNIVFEKPIHDICQNQSLKKLQCFNIKDNVSLIKKSLFSGFNNLVRVNIPNSVESIEDEAFFNCPNLTFVNIPDSIKGNSIGKRAFSNCPKLKCIKMPNNLTKIEDETFKGDESLSKIVLNVGLEKICKEVFYGCNSIQNVKIPGSVTFIDENAFYKCKNLKAIIFEGKKPNMGKKVMSSSVCVIYDS